MNNLALKYVGTCQGGDSYRFTKPKNTFFKDAYISFSLFRYLPCIPSSKDENTVVVSTKV